MFNKKDNFNIAYGMVLGFGLSFIIWLMTQADKGMVK